MKKKSRRCKQLILSLTALESIKLNKFLYTFGTLLSTFTVGIVEQIIPVIFP